MSYVKKKSYKSEYSVIYSDMLGADMNGDGSNIAKNRFAYLENMYRDYRGGRGSVESVPGYRKLFKTEFKCHFFKLIAGIRTVSDNHFSENTLAEIIEPARKQSESFFRIKITHFNAFFIHFFAEIKSRTKLINVIGSDINNLCVGEICPVADALDI